MKLKRKTQTKDRKKSNYIDNAKLLEEVIKYKKAIADNGGKFVPVTEELAKYFILIANNLSSKGNFISYSWKDEMISDGIENCLHRSTKILTMEYGPAAIENLIGKSITVKAADGIWRKATVRCYGKQKLYKYSFGSFNLKLNQVRNYVIATENHRWFVQARRNSKNCLDWKNEIITDLKIGDMLQSAATIEEKDPTGIIHGLIFGDGCVEKKSVKYGPRITVTQGREYPFIRVCKQDVVRDEIENIFRSAGHVPTYPKSAKGDPVFYLGRGYYQKEFPFTLDPSYIRGFIYGWWLADGSKTVMKDKRLVISTINSDAIKWLEEYAAYGGYNVVGVRETHGGTGFTKELERPNPLYTITLASHDKYDVRVRSIEEYGEDEVFCVEEPVTHGFVLANGILTGNCIQYAANFNPEKSTNAFTYFSTIMFYAFVRRIKKENKQLYCKYKSFLCSDLMNDDEVLTIIQNHDNFKEHKLEFIDRFEESMMKKNKK